MQKSVVESLAKMRHPLESSTMTLGTPVLKILFDQVDPDLIKWTDGTELIKRGLKLQNPAGDEVWKIIKYLVSSNSLSSDRAARDNSHYFIKDRGLNSWFMFGIG
jgi:hypothetical protein